MDWFLDPDDDRRKASDRTRDLLLEAASVLGAHHVKVGNIPGTAASLSQLTERFGELCDYRRRAHRREDRVRAHAARHERAHPRRRPGGGRRAARRERRHRDRHVAHVEARHRARRPPADPARVPELDRALRRTVRRHGRPDRRGHQPPQPPRRGRVRHQGLHQGLRGSRLPGAVGRGDTLRGAPQQPDRRHLPAGVRDRPPRNSNTRGAQREHTGRQRSRPRRARLDVPPDAADPRVRGAGQAHVPGPPGCDPRPHAPRRRRRGLDRRLDRDAPPRRPVLRDVPLPRLPDRARHRRERDDGRDLRAQRRRLQGHRRLDAPDRRLERLPRHVGDRRRRESLTPPARPGRRRSASRARSSSASSATAPRSRARSPRRSTSRRSGSCRSYS